MRLLTLLRLRLRHGLRLRLRRGPGRRLELLRLGWRLLLGHHYALWLRLDRLLRRRLERLGGGT